MLLQYTQIYHVVLRQYTQIYHSVIAAHQNLSCNVILVHTDLLCSPALVTTRETFFIRNYVTFQFRYIWSLLYFGPTIGLVIIYLHIFFILNRREKLLVNSENRRTLLASMKVSNLSITNTDTNIVISDINGLVVIFIVLLSSFFFIVVH